MAQGHKVRKIALVEVSSPAGRCKVPVSEKDIYLQQEGWEEVKTKGPRNLAIGCPRQWGLVGLVIPSAILVNNMNFTQITKLDNELKLGVSLSPQKRIDNQRKEINAEIERRFFNARRRIKSIR